MTDEQMRVKIAEACGFRRIGLIEGSMDLMGELPPCRGWVRIPNYPNDLNACHEMWQCLGWEEKNECIEHLREIVKDADCEVYFATARQRCEAFLRTIGQWEEQ